MPFRRTVTRRAFGYVRRVGLYSRFRIGSVKRMGRKVTTSIGHTRSQKRRKAPDPDDLERQLLEEES